MGILAHKVKNKYQQLTWLYLLFFNVGKWNVSHHLYLLLCVYFFILL
ncbi:hypothetical protein M23134_04835 [Microscilla marina ATCC 23134]|uniref:Uncharacterized protein n=1 Tax=Microscilla marina ATCC 23134 TaxID=313606 RepID=A1ZRZ7_MICM2|nr:hypothetical protein M23134_04835 [Microscilla marina ATCC 23134]